MCLHSLRVLGNISRSQYLGTTREVGAVAGLLWKTVCHRPAVVGSRSGWVLGWTSCLISLVMFTYILAFYGVFFVYIWTRGSFELKGRIILFLFQGEEVEALLFSSIKVLPIGCVVGAICGLVGMAWKDARKLSVIGLLLNVGTLVFEFVGVVFLFWGLPWLRNYPLV